jgi:hypothetical protein
VIDENHRYPVLKTRLVDEYLHPAFGKNFFPGKKFQPPVGGAVSIFSPAKSRAVVRRYPYQALNGWTVCRFHGAPGGKRNGNYRYGSMPFSV